MQKIGCSIGVLYYGDLSSLKSQFQSVESVYFLLLTGRVPLAAYWIRVILFDASTRQLCPACNHELETLALLSYF